MNETRFFICEHCKNIVGVIQSSGVPMKCCGQNMTELIPGTVDAALEKHVPVVTLEDNLVKVKVGEVTHPMTEEHYIQWIYLQTDKGGQRKALTPADAPEAVFALCDEKPVAVYEYCNLHGLWKADI
ncbi:MAG: desulfoferrodoxin [Ruminococcaceae bacterium]|nr:desulfoferrodoxin [Oscillospiraceae bacterium]